MSWRTERCRGGPAGGHRDLVDAGRGPDWSYLLPSHRPRGHYRVDAIAVDGAGNGSAISARLQPGRLLRPMTVPRIVVAALVAAAAAPAGAAAAAPRVEVMVAGKASVLAAPRFVRASATTVAVGRRRCGIAAATPLAALAAVRRGHGPAFRLRDYGACSRRAVDSSALFVTQIGPDRNRRADGWVYKVGRRVPSVGSADPSGHRLRTGERLTWFYCRAQSGGRVPAHAGGGAAVGRRAGAARAGARLRRQRPRGRRGRRHGLRGRPDRGHRGGRHGELPGARRGHAQRAGPAGRHDPLVPGAGGLGMRPALVAALLLAALVVAGCGLGAGAGTGGVSLVVTRDFGDARVGGARADRVPGSETVMRFLARSFSVQTRYGGGFVQAINGLSGQYGSGRRVDWFYYVNGIEADEGRGGVPPSPRRPRVVGSPRLERGAARAGGRRFVPRAVSARARGPAPADADRLCE